MDTGQGGSQQKWIKKIFKVNILGFAKEDDLLSTKYVEYLSKYLSPFPQKKNYCLENAIKKPLKLRKKVFHEDIVVLAGHEKCTIFMLDLKLTVSQWDHLG